MNRVARQTRSISRSAARISRNLIFGVSYLIDAAFKNPLLRNPDRPNNIRVSRGVGGGASVAPPRAPYSRAVSSLVFAHDAVSRSAIRVTRNAARVLLSLSAVFTFFYFRNHSSSSGAVPSDSSDLSTQNVLSI